MDEEWRPVPGYEGRYEVSNLGRVRYSVIRIVKPIPIKNGYLSVSMRDSEGKKKTHLIHRLVLSTFTGPCPEGLEARHLNDKNTDNRLDNLEWGTRLQNVKDRFRNRGGRYKSPRN